MDNKNIYNLLKDIKKDGFSEEASLINKALKKWGDNHKVIASFENTSEQETLNLRTLRQWILNDYRKVAFEIHNDGVLIDPVDQESFMQGPAMLITGHGFRPVEIAVNVFGEVGINYQDGAWSRRKVHSENIMSFYEKLKRILNGRKGD